MDGWTGGRVDGWTGGRVDGWTGGRVDGWTGGRVDGWTGVGINIQIPSNQKPTINGSDLNQVHPLTRDPAQMGPIQNHFSECPQKRSEGRSKTIRIHQFPCNARLIRILLDPSRIGPSLVKTGS